MNRVKKVRRPAKHSACPSCGLLEDVTAEGLLVREEQERYV